MRSGARVAKILALAAAPTFAAMAFLTALEASPARICGAGPTRAWLTGMTPMYLLMSAFHAGAWLQRAERRRLH